MLGPVNRDVVENEKNELILATLHRMVQYGKLRHSGGGVFADTCYIEDLLSIY